MIPIFEIEKRAIQGPVMKVDDFDLALVKKVRKLVKEYDIGFNPEELIVDDESADRVFNAAVDYLAEIGLYHQDTQRVIKFTKNEILEMVKEYKDDPKKDVTFGSGKDEHTITPRNPGDGKRPTLWVFPGGTSREETVIPYIQLCAEEQLIQGFGITSSGIRSFKGIEPVVGTPGEIFCTIREQEANHEGLKRAGRPDMFLGLIPTATSLAANLAPIAIGLCHSRNSMVGIHIMPEQKIDWTRINLAAIAEECGIHPWVSAMSLFGGLSGGAAGTAICLTANFLAQLAYSHGKLGSIFASDMSGDNINRGSLWAYSAAARAIGRNVGIAHGNISFSGAFPVRDIEEFLLRSFAGEVSITASGAAYSWAAGTNPIEARIHNEIMIQVSGMRREKANAILNAMLTEIESLDRSGILIGENAYNAFPNKYDIKTLKPKKEFIDSCKKITDKLVKFGVPISNNIDFS